MGMTPDLNATIRGTRFPLWSLPYLLAAFALHHNGKSFPYVCLPGTIRERDSLIAVPILTPMLPRQAGVQEYRESLDALSSHAYNQPNVLYLVIILAN